MIINGTIKSNKKTYKIKMVTVGEYQQYSAIVKEAKNPYVSLDFLIKKTIFREVEVKIFGITIKKWKIFDFDVNLIPISTLDKFQEDYFKVIFGEPFFRQMKERGDAQKVDVIKNPQV